MNINGTLKNCTYQNWVNLFLQCLFFISDSSLIFILSLAVFRCERLQKRDNWVPFLFAQ